MKPMRINFISSSLDLLIIGYLVFSPISGDVQASQITGSGGAVGLHVDDNLHIISTLTIGIRNIVFAVFNIILVCLFKTESYVCSF